MLTENLIDISSGEKPYRCMHCKKAFTQHGTLKRHLHTCKVAKPQAENDTSSISSQPGPSWRSCSALPPIPPPPNVQENFIRPPFLPPPLAQNAIEQWFPRPAEQQPNTTTPFPFEDVFRFLFENILAQQNAPNSQSRQHDAANRSNAEEAPLEPGDVNDQPEVSDFLEFFHQIG